MSKILDALKDNVLLCDGGMGSYVQSMDLDVEEDYWGNENCTEILNLSRPELIKDIHNLYLAAGSDLIQTNSFGGSSVTLAEFDLQDRTEEINRAAVAIARECCDAFTAKDGRERYVLGSIGPGTKLPSLAHIDYDSLEAGLIRQAEGLAEGGCDALLIETCQDPLQIKAAINAVKQVRSARGWADDDWPIFVQVTVETTGTLLVGADIAAAATVIHAMGVHSLGLNCATGPQEMAQHVSWMTENWPHMISLQPNAGLPELRNGQTFYPLTPEELAQWHQRFLTEDGLNFIGGCCGTDASHIEAVHKMLCALAEKQGRQSHRPAPLQRTPEWQPSVASLYNQVPFYQENAYLSIGERCNANGSKKFRELQDDENWEACVAIGVQQVREGSHTIDLCTAFVGRDEIHDMTAMVSRMRGSVNAPLVIDSTELPVLEAALKLYGGKAILNSINFEDGEAPAEARMALAKKFGAAVVALTIDEEGMAKTADQKVAIAKRLHAFACETYGLPESDLLFDPLTFTICTGNEDDRRLGIETLDAIERISQALPNCQIILGLSNISFGLNAAARHVLNSVFLDHAVKRGMTGAIVHLSKILPLHKIPAEEVKAAEDLIYDRRAEGYDPLHAFIDLFRDRKASEAKTQERPKEIEARLSQRIVDGDRQGLDEDLREAMAKYDPLTIVNDHLLGGMKVVGELFGAGKMQLPFVLQSAETMKAAVSFLEPHMEKIDGQEKGKILLATVKGDVHDIGKNLVDIILTNNGYKVINIGIKQPIENIVQAIEEHAPDAVGLSGLLVKSTVIMRENLETLSQQQINLPVFLGGAALTRAYVEEDCTQAYHSGRVAYARDAFDGLTLMDKVVNGQIDGYFQERKEQRQERPQNTKRQLGRAAQADQRPVDVEETRVRREELAAGVELPTPPFLGPQVIARVPTKALIPFLNERMLYQFQWGYRKEGRSLAEYMTWSKQELRPILNRMLDLCAQEDILKAQAVYGYWPANAEGNDVIVYDPEDQDKEVARFTLPRQAREGGLCIADFLRDVSSGEKDILGLQVVTMGQKVADVAREWFEGDRYQDYLYLHGLGVELTEALAEYVHKRIRGELGFGHEDDRDMEKMLNQGYRGSRYSFGYPACPTMEDQTHLMRLLQAEQIGVVMSDEFQLHPEQSTSAIVLHHPQAKYFSV